MTTKIQARPAPAMLNQYRLPNGEKVGKTRVLKDAVKIFSSKTGQGLTAWNNLPHEDRAAYVAAALGVLISRATERASRDKRRASA